MNTTSNREQLDALYRRYNSRELVHPDPVEFLYLYPDVADREVVALVAASLAYGRVKQILRSVEDVLARLVPSPSAFVDHTTLGGMMDALRGFRHRFTSGREMAAMLFGVGIVRLHYGSLEACLRRKLDESGALLPALDGFVTELTRAAGVRLPHLLSSPAGGSACKRLHLFLRWMVRCDEVDPGGWRLIPPSELMVPLDVHMHRLGRRMGWTRRRQADLRAAAEITDAFRSIVPEDPVRYDFALTRMGIRGDAEPAEVLQRLN